MKTWIYLFFLLILSSFVSSQPALNYITFQGDRGYEIEFPLVRAITQDQDYKFYFHVFNISNGLPITDTSCSFHLYNSVNGDHLHKEFDIRMLEHKFDYEVEVSGTNFSSIQPYRYIFQCNDTAAGLGGYVEVVFEVTKDGLIPNEDKNNMIPSLILFLVLINLAFFILPFKVRFTKTEAGDYMVKRFMWVVAFLLLWFNTTLLKEMAIHYNLGVDNYLQLYWWFFTLGMFVAIFYISYVGLVGSIKLMKEAKMKQRMGDYNQR